MLPVPWYFLSSSAFLMRLRSVIVLPLDQLGDASEFSLKVSVVRPVC